MRYKLSLILITLFALFLLALLVYKETSDQTTVRFFCVNGRVFIEFEERHNTWGTMWLDNRGKPMQCDDTDPVIESTSSFNI